MDTAEKLINLKKFLIESTVIDSEKVYYDIEHYLLVNSCLPFYITGVLGHQGKRELKRMLLDLGFTNVYERNEMYSLPYKPISEGEDVSVDASARELFNLIGYVIDFGTFCEPEFDINFN